MKKHKRMGIFFTKNKQGFTLVEVILTIALLSVILLIATSLITTGQKMYKKGITRSDIQFDVRMAADFVTEELRNATHISLDGTAPNLEEYNQIYVAPPDKRILYKAPGGSPTGKTQDIIETAEGFSLHVELQNGKYFLVYSINGNDGIHSFSTDTKVMLNNVNASKIYGSHFSAVNTSHTIYYKKASSTAPSPIPITPPVTPPPPPPPPVQTPGPLVITAEGDTFVEIDLGINLKNPIKKTGLIDTIEMIPSEPSTKVRFTTYEQPNNNTTVEFYVSDSLGNQFTIQVNYQNHVHDWENPVLK